jgi:hypothetical protein
MQSAQFGTVRDSLVRRCFFGSRNVRHRACGFALGGNDALSTLEPKCNSQRALGGIPFHLQCTHALPGLSHAQFNSSSFDRQFSTFLNAGAHGVGNFLEGRHLLRG